MSGNNLDEVSEWSGRDLFDVRGQRIGSIVGLGYARRKFGATWLLVDTGGPRAVLVPADQMSCTGDRLVLPYPKTYVEGGLAAEPGQPLSADEERRLRLYYGIGAGSLDPGCYVGCGMCMIGRRDKHRRASS